jgi:PAS domain S-box-containing protein
MSRRDVQSWLCEDLFDLVPLRIAVIDRDLKIVTANRQFTDAYGPSDGRNCYEAYKHRTSKCEHCGAIACFEDGQIRVREEEGVGLDGESRWYLVHIVPLKSHDGGIPYVLEMSTDISPMKQLQREKLEAERLAAVGQTVAGLSHGIKNIVMGLEGGIYVVNSAIRRNDPDRLVTGWGMLEEEISRISAFAKEFLEFAKGRKPRVAVIDPNEPARKVVALFRDRAEQAGIELVAELEADLAPAPMDAEGIHVCLSNLVSNAIDACEMSDKERNLIRVVTHEDEGSLVYEVTDDGCGMEYDVKRKVFTSYFSTKAAGRGTGLGLLTTRKLVQEHGGRVGFESSEGEGSTFRLEFPRDRLPSANPAPGSVGSDRSAQGLEAG